MGFFGVFWGFECLVLYLAHMLLWLVTCASMLPGNTSNPGRAAVAFWDASLFVSCLAQLLLFVGLWSGATVQQAVYNRLQAEKLQTGETRLSEQGLPSSCGFREFFGVSSCKDVHC